MRLQDFDYELPETLIAQEALSDRGASRLLIVDRSGAAEPRGMRFRNLTEILDENDVIVVNRSRVVPARLLLRRSTGGRVEALFLRRTGEMTFEAWLRPLRKLKPDEKLVAEDDATAFRFVEATGERAGRLRLDGDVRVSLDQVLDRIGHVPLPPYIRRPDSDADRSRYQTVYARERGSVAAPTAGLHFDQRLLADLEAQGTGIISLILHVGTGTFAPLEHEEVERNTLHPERIELEAATIEAITEARSNGRRIIAVGTTVMRALEAAAAQNWLEGRPQDRRGETNLFIYPGYVFSVVDGLITNFHLPRSSLLLLVCAFAGTDRILASYRTAVEEGYRFYSYGDAMIIR